MVSFLIGIGGYLESASTHSYIRRSWLTETLTWIVTNQEVLDTAPQCLAIDDSYGQNKWL
jgi:hypothetical protein